MENPELEKNIAIEASKNTWEAGQKDLIKYNELLAAIDNESEQKG